MFMVNLALYGQRLNCKTLQIKGYYLRSKRRSESISLVLPLKFTPGQLWKTVALFVQYFDREKNMAIVWSSDLNTGIDVIDDQHKSIVDYINQLEYAISQGNRATVGNVLNDLVDYTLSHFAFEESLQQEAGYAYAIPHKAIHDIFVKRVAKYQAEHKAGDDVAEQTHSMLSTWLVHHIKRDDMAYVSEVKANIDRIVNDKKEGGWLSRSLGKLFK